MLAGNLWKEKSELSQFCFEPVPKQLCFQVHVDSTKFSISAEDKYCHSSQRYNQQYTHPKVLIRIAPKQSPFQLLYSASTGPTFRRKYSCIDCLNNAQRPEVLPPQRSIQTKSRHPLLSAPVVFENAHRESPQLCAPLVREFRLRSCSRNMVSVAIPLHNNNSLGSCSVH